MIFQYKLLYLLLDIIILFPSKYQILSMKVLNFVYSKNIKQKLSYLSEYKVLFYFFVFFAGGGAACFCEWFLGRIMSVLCHHLL